MRIALRVLLPLMAFAFLVAPAYAAPEEPAAPPADPAPAPKKPDPSKALFIGESLMPGEKEAPEGWELEDDDASAEDMEEKLNAIGEDLNLDEDSFYVQMQSFKKGGALVTSAMVDVDEKVYAYRHYLTAKAAEFGWSVSDLGHPGRILVLRGPATEVGALQKALKEHTIYALSEMAMNRLRGRAGHEDAGRDAARKYVGYIGSLAPETGTANAVIGVLHWITSRKDMKKRGDKPNRAEEENAVAHFGKSLKEGIAFPPKGSVRVFAAAQMGGIILTWKDRSKLPQATRALEVAVKYEKDGKRMNQRFESRYNLTCAYARAKRIDDAFDMLRKSLEVLKNMPPQQWRQSHKHAEEKDPDMGPLRDDPRFSKLMDEFKPPAPKKRPMPKNHPPVGGEDGKEEGK